ncbi:MAG: CoA transferase [Chloroflexi bacterium]|nr:CoA transferase [Chloroflexota bacterium]
MAARYSDGVLGDLRVVEIGEGIGAWCGKLMADLGADVIKAEPPLGSAEREIGPFYEDTDTTYKGDFPINTDGGQISGGQPGCRTQPALLALQHK